MKRFRQSLALAVGLLLAAGAAAADQTPVASGQTLQGRGVFYLDGRVRCPLAGVGTRGAQASNRIALDDADTTARVDGTQITVVNRRRYPHTQVIGDLLVLAQGTTRGGEQMPVGVHLKIEKRGDRFTTSMHPHPTTRDSMVSADFEPYTVSVSDGRTTRVVFTPTDILKAIREPTLTARLANIVIQVDDRLEGLRLDPTARDAALVELDIGVGLEPINLKVARVSLRSLDPANAPLIARGAVADMFAQGAWELRITSLTPFLPREEFDRDFFLLGLDQLPAVQSVIRNGLRKGESLVVGYRDGQGFIGVDAATTPIAAPADVARAYLEFNFVGGLLARQLARLPQRLAPLPTTGAATDRR